MKMTVGSVCAHNMKYLEGKLVKQLIHPSQVNVC